MSTHREGLYKYADAIGILSRGLTPKEVKQLDRYAWARLGGGPREYSPFATWRKRQRKAAALQAKHAAWDAEYLARACMCHGQYVKLQAWMEEIRAAGCRTLQEAYELGFKALMAPKEGA